MPHNVFLSYSRADTFTMQRVRDDLRTSGLTVWTDEGIETGTRSWKQAIQTAILEAHCLVCLLSPDAANSHWVQEELNFAELHHKSVYLILVRGDEKEAVPFGFSTHQWVDIRRPEQYKPGLDKLIGVLRRRIGELITTNPSLNFAPTTPAETATMPQANPLLADIKLTPLYTTNLDLPTSHPSDDRHGIKASKPILPQIGDILPEPFAWCAVPAGEVTLDYGSQGKQTFAVPAFEIAKYPITNAQYQVFISAIDGYRDGHWWEFSPFAVDWRKQNPVPRTLAFMGDDLPRTNVTLYEAVAFCRWLTNRLGAYADAPTIAICTEQQWQRAAQGDDGRMYPWGNQPSHEHANYGNRQIHPVTQYPSGASPFGVIDLLGNCWEWCLSDYESSNLEVIGNALCAVRGGHFRSTDLDIRVTYRKRLKPDEFGNAVGFRIVQRKS